MNHLHFKPEYSVAYKHLHGAVAWWLICHQLTCIRGGQIFKVNYYRELDYI